MRHALYAWRIDDFPDVEDIGPVEPPGTVIEGPEGASNDWLTRLRNGEGRPFRLLDGDGLHYASGRIITTEDGVGSELDFKPLDDAGLPAWGCAGIQYQDSAGEWEDL